MVVDENARGSYSEEFDIKGLRELCEMAKLYVARENDFKGNGKDVPDGTYSDFCCIVWELFTETVRYGMWLEKKREERDRLKNICGLLERKKKVLNEIENDLNSWKKPLM